MFVFSVEPENNICFRRESSVVKKARIQLRLRILVSPNSPDLLPSLILVSIISQTWVERRQPCLAAKKTDLPKLAKSLVIIRYSVASRLRLEWSSVYYR